MQIYLSAPSFAGLLNESTNSLVYIVNSDWSCTIERVCHLVAHL